MRILDKITILNTKIINKFQEFLKNGRVMLFEAPCGFGKTTLIRELLKDVPTKVYEVRADEIDFDRLSDIEWDILFADDLQDMQNDDHKRLCDIIRTNPDKRFMLASRGSICGDLISFRIAGLLTEVDENDMFFDRALTEEYFALHGIAVSKSQISSIMNLTMGYPLAIELLTKKLSDGAEYTQNIVEEARYELYRYYDEMIFCRFKLAMRRFLMELAPFDSFDTELAMMASGDADAGKKLSFLQKCSRMMKINKQGQFSFWEVYRDFLIWEQNSHYTPEQRRALYSRGGLYYELRGDYAKALDFYTKSKEENRVSELIIKIISLHPGMGHYEDLEKYYLTLSDEVIKASPALMQGKSVLCALSADYDGAEQWYDELKMFEQMRRYDDAAAIEARNRLIWLDISLPGRDMSEMADTIKRAYDGLMNKQITLMPFTVTSTLPSVLNGAKDLSDWTKNTEEMYESLKQPLEVVFGRDGVCLAECGYAESKFEKGENVSDLMLSLISRLNEIHHKGTPDIEFAVVAILVRNQLAGGKTDDARHTLNQLRERFSADGHTRFMPNIDAMLCVIALYCCDMDSADEWYRNKAPRDSLKIKVMKRYQYLTEAMTELFFGNEDAALLTLSPLERFFEQTQRHIDTIHLKILKAIAKSRKGDKSWRDDFCSAMEIAEEYGFIRTIGKYGAAVLPMLEQVYDSKATDFVKNVIKMARTQAVYYPDFLKPQNIITEKLTDAEMQVLRLLCADKSNSEIGKILNIQLATVKSHVSHILQKLDVKRRSEAKTTAERLHIV